MLKRTTLFAEEETLQQLRRIAAAKGKSMAEITRQAIREFLDLHQSKRGLLALSGIGRSGRHDIAERAEELLWQEDHPRRRAKKAS